MLPVDNVSINEASLTGIRWFQETHSEQYNVHWRGQAQQVDNVWLKYSWHKEHSTLSQLPPTFNHNIHIRLVRYIIQTPNRQTNGWLTTTDWSSRQPWYNDLVCWLLWHGHSISCDYLQRSHTKLCKASDLTDKIMFFILKWKIWKQGSNGALKQNLQNLPGLGRTSATDSIVSLRPS